MQSFSGYLTALITPFANGKVDFAAFEKFVAWQCEQNIHGLVPCGTTGESPTLSFSETEELIKRTIATRNGSSKKIPVIAGTGSNDTARTVETTKLAEQLGADAALIVTPYYNKPTQDGLYAHYKFIHDQTNIPIILYNVPGRTAVDMSLDTIIRLSALPRIVGLKDAVSDLSRVTLLKRSIKNSFALLCGEDGLAAGYLAQGGHGCISVTSNIAPALCAALYEAWLKNDKEQFETIQSWLAPLHKNLFIETSPAPVKYAASVLGFGSDEMRLPLLPATQTTRTIIDSLLNDLQMLEQNSNPPLKAAM